MEPRKYSTGTKGRIKMHADQCREFIQTHSPNFSLATEFIEQVDSEREDRVWQRFQTPGDILPELQDWLGGSEAKQAPPVPPAHPPAIPRAIGRTDIKPASKLPPKPSGSPVDVAYQKARAWLAIESSRSVFASLSPADAADAALRQFYQELTGAPPPPATI